MKKNLQARTNSLDQKQRESLRAFDKELFSYTGQLAWFLPSLFSFLVLILMAIPVQELAKDGRSVGITTALFSLWISFFLLMPYVQYKKLRYFPIGRRQYILVRMGYLFRYLWKLTVIGLMFQSLTAIFIFKRLDFWNIVYPVIILLVLPLATGWLQLRWER